MSLESNKKIVTEFLQDVVAGRIAEAYEKHVDPSGRHHNAYNAAGFAELRKGMEENQALFPNKEFKTHLMVAEGDLVIAFSRICFGGKDLAVMHAFRLKDGKIAEMWDCGQELPADMPNKDGAF